MRNLSRISLAIAASAALAGSIALPASAAPFTDTTVTTVQVEAGVLSITAPEVAAPTGEIAPGATATVALTGVSVSDLRAGTIDWEASVSLTDFTADLVVGAAVIPATAATYTPGTAVPTGTVTLKPATQSDLSSLKPVQTATAVVGNNTATWAADLTVVVPDQALADSYTATLTHSVV